MNKRFTIGLVVLLSLSFSVQAADEDGQFAIKGVGNATCKQYIAESKKRSHNFFLYAGWINGYLTAQNQHLKDTFDLVSWETIHTLGNYLSGYCEKHPERSFYLALATMLNAMFDQRVMGFSPVKTLGSGEAAVIVYKETLKRAQQKLAEQGLYAGKLDGEYGPATEEALQAFQKKADIEVTGLPDQATLFQLLRKK